MLDGRIFRSVSDLAGGEVGPQTVFAYRQDGELVEATCSGDRALRLPDRAAAGRSAAAAGDVGAGVTRGRRTSVVEEVTPEPA